jgi:hypothetical protein
MINIRASAPATHNLLRLLLALFFAPALPGFERACPASTTNTSVAAVFCDTRPGTTPDLAREIARDVRAAGYATELIGADILTNSAELLSRKFDLLVLPQARSLPAAAMDAVSLYLRNGGRMMALGLPAWESPGFAFDGRLLSQQEYQRVIDSQVADHVIIDFARDDLSKWQRNADTESTKTQAEAVTDGQQKVLHAVVENLAGWYVLLSPPLSDPFTGGRTLTCFRARGSKDTTEMSIEWDETDGSRWIATIDLTPDWKLYCLPPEAFHFWESTPGRGGGRDGLDVRHAARISVGLARTHSALPGAHHEYWIGSLGTARSPFASAPSPAAVNAPQIDTLSPGWNFYSMHGLLKVATPEKLALVSGTGADRIVCFTEKDDSLPQAMQPRPRGAGFNQERPWRWQPLLEACSPHGDYRGALATLLVHCDGDYRGGIWACFTPQNAAFYQQTPARELLRQTAVAMRRGLFLEEGGSEFFTVFEHQSFYLGGRAVNFGKTDQTNLALRISVKPKAGGATVFKREWPLALAAGARRMAQEQWQPARWPAGGLLVTTELLQEGRVIDRLEHDLNVWRPKAKAEFVEEREGGFRLRGRPWKVNGVNYMPATGLGGASGGYFEFWLGKGAYDPEVIERDLRRIKAMNLNAVSIFVYHSELPAQHLLDFLRRCETLGLHVNQSLRPGTPLDFHWDEMKQLIEFYHMAENDTIFAYDLAWEAEHQDEQNSYGRDWIAWVNNRYGSMVQAQSAWGVPAPSLDGSGTLAVPSLHLLAEDGAWRILAADYRAFLDNELAQKYGEARRLVRSIDPHHAVSFRMSEAGDPTLHSDRRLPFDFYGLAEAVDIWEPEAYGRIGDWNRVREGRFETDYARLCNPNKPLMWAEMGYSVWNAQRAEASPEREKFAAAYCRDFYRMMSEAGDDGVVFWWYPGGFRLNEGSDFGIINPDGTDRPITPVIRAEGSAFLKAPKPPRPNCVIQIDRDRDARGLYGIHQAVKKDYWQAIADGKIPALQWEKKPGTH